MIERHAYPAASRTIPQVVEGLIDCARSFFSFPIIYLQITATTRPEFHRDCRKFPSVPLSELDRQ